MLKDLTRADWLRLLIIPEERIPRTLILRGTRNLRTQYQIAAAHFTNILEIGSPNGLIEDVFIGDLDDIPVGFACVYGAPMASEIVHIFGMLGTRAVIQTGNCGALADDLLAGDLFIAVEAFCGEGAAQYYKTDGKIVSASRELLQTASIAKLGQVKTGSNYTTSALFAEGDAELEDWYNQGFAAVDMETASTYAVAEYFDMQRLSLLFVFDNPRRREHLLLTDAEKDERRAAADEMARRVALDLVRELA